MITNSSSPSNASPSAPFQGITATSHHAELFAAIKDADARQVIEIIDQFEPDMSAVDSEGHTAIHLAIALRHHKIAAQMLARLPEGHSALSTRDGQGYTPLMLAVEQGSIPLSKSLIQKGATVHVGDDANCSEARLEDKKATLSAAELLLETGGDVEAAFTLANKRDNRAFTYCFRAPYLELRKVSARGDIAQTRALIDAGMDAAHTLMRVVWLKSMRDPSAAQSAPTLIAAGADPTLAMTKALTNSPLDTSDKGCVPILLMLGASGEKVLTSAAGNFHSEAVSLLASQGVRADDALIQHAKHGNVDAVKLLLTNAPQKALDTTRVLQALAKGGHQHAVELLLAEGVDADKALTQFIQEGNKAAVKLLVDAGVDASNRFTALVASCRTSPEGMTARLETLIAAGVDPSRALYELGATDIRTAKILIAAGAKIPAALHHASSSEFSDIQEALLSASRDVAAVRAAMHHAGDDDIRLLENILLARDDIAQPAKSDYRAHLKTLAEAYDARGNKACADLMRAVEQVDWASIKALVADVDADADDVDADADASSQVLADLSDARDVLLGRLLATAGAHPKLVLGLALRDGWKGDTGIPHLSFLLDIGFEPYDVMEALSALNGDDAVKAFVQNKGMDMFETLKGVAARIQPDELKRFISQIMDDGGQGAIKRAVVEGNTELVAALAAAGVKLKIGPYEFFQVVGNVNIELAKTLAALGVVPPHDVLAKRLTMAAEREDVQSIHSLLALGADVHEALLGAFKKDEGRAAITLLYLGGDLSHVQSYARTHDDRKVQSLLKEMHVE